MYLYIDPRAQVFPLYDALTGSDAEVAIHSFAFFYGGKNANIWGVLVSSALNSSCLLICRKPFLFFEWACVKKVKTELICNLQIHPITVRPGCETMAASKKLEIEMSKWQWLFSRNTSRKSKRLAGIQKQLKVIICKPLQVLFQVLGVNNCPGLW